jgi:hypothetical protein
MVRYVKMSCAHFVNLDPSPPWDTLTLNVAIWLILQLILIALVMGKAFKCRRCKRSFRGSSDKVNRSNRDRHQREECMPGKRQTKLMRKRVDLLFSVW